MTESERWMMMLDAYLDDQLAADERCRFEAVLATDPQLRAAAQLQSAIDTAISRRLSAPGDSRFDVAASAATWHAQTSRGEASASNAPHAARWRWRMTAWPGRLAAAAALATAFFGGWLTWNSLRPRSTSPRFIYPQPAITLSGAYEQLVRSNLRPDWICENEEQFREMFEVTQGHPLQLQPLPGGEAPLGVCNVNIEGLSPATLAVLFRIDGRPVIVFIDRQRGQGAGLPPQTPLDPGVHAHRRLVDGFVLYELSPFQSPRTLEHFYNPGGGGD